MLSGKKMWTAWGNSCSLSGKVREVHGEAWREGGKEGRKGGRKTKKERKVKGWARYFLCTRICSANSYLWTFLPGYGVIAILRWECAVG